MTFVRYFNIKDIPGIIDFIKQECTVEKGQTIHVSGATSFVFMKQLEEALGVNLVLYFEVQYQINWVLYMNKVNSLKDFIIPYDPTVEEEAIKMFSQEGQTKYAGSKSWLEREKLQYPFMMVNVGSTNVSYTIKEDGSISNHETFWDQGKIFQVLTTLLTGKNSMDEIFAMARKGKSQNVDFGMADIFNMASNAGVTEKMEKVKPSESDAGSIFFMGKIANDLENIDEYRKEDIVASMLRMWMASLATSLILKARNENVKQVVLYASFIDVDIVRDTFIKCMTARNIEQLQMYGKEPVEYLFLENGSFAGCLGNMVAPVHDKPFKDQPIGFYWT